MSTALSVRIPSPTHVDTDSDTQSVSPFSPLTKPKSVAVLLKSQKDHNNAFRVDRVSNQFFLDSLQESADNLEIRSSDAFIGKFLGKIKQKSPDDHLSSLTIWSHGIPTEIQLGLDFETGRYTIDEVNGQHFASLKDGAPIYLVSCSTAPIGRKIAQESRHPVYAPSKNSDSDRTFLIPNQNGEWELVQYDIDGNHITKLFRYVGDDLVELEPKAYQNAFQYLLGKAQEGNAAAEFMIGEFYFHGKEVGCSLETAVHWYTKAARQGHPNALEQLKILADLGFDTAALELASMYREGKGVEKSDEEANKWTACAKRARKQSKDCCVVL